ncbi:MAG: hypothetical protein ACREJ9_15425 [Candidatus Rokuibacteriota bacterium]
MTILIGLLVARPAEASEGVCAPGALVKVVTRLDVPGVPATHFTRVPKTLFRYGSQYARVEEAHNPVTGLHLLVVVNEPHIWITNLATRTGRYVRDPGPTYDFRARIFGDAAAKSPLIRRLEFGCEVSWFKDSGAVRRSMRHPTLGEVRALEYSEGAEKVILYERADRPLRLELIEQGTPTFAVDYLEYVPGLTLERRLFEKPPGIAFDREN